MVKISIDIDTSKYNITEEQSKNILKKTLDLSTQELIRNLRKNSPKDTGRLRGSWMEFKTGEYTREVKSSTIYADYLDKGTGIYGPKGKPITPKKTGGVLRFTVPDAKVKGAENGVVFAKSVKGIKPRHFVRNSINETKNKINDIAIKAIMES